MSQLAKCFACGVEIPKGAGRYRVFWVDFCTKCYETAILGSTEGRAGQDGRLLGREGGENPGLDRDLGSGVVYPHPRCAADFGGVI